MCSESLQKSLARDAVLQELDLVFQCPQQLSVNFRRIKVQAGSEMDLEDVLAGFQVKLENSKIFDEDKQYTIVMVDPDAPSRDNPTSR